MDYSYIYTINNLENSTYKVIKYLSVIFFRIKLIRLINSTINYTLYKLNNNDHSEELIKKKMVIPIYENYE